VVCGAGPGSFTSLRIAASIAKGIADACGVPLYAVSSLLLIVAGYGAPAPGEYLALLDAMRGQWFAAHVRVPSAGPPEQVGPARLLDGLTVADESARLAARTIGPGCAIDARPRARGVARLVGELERAGPVDLATWEPDYGRKAEAQVRWEAAYGRALPGA
jgi:tRNA threonylcarbamoyladenosine biosynthesis protein TsaB